MSLGRIVKVRRVGQGVGRVVLGRQEMGGVFVLECVGEATQVFNLSSLFGLIFMHFDTYLCE